MDHENDVEMSFRPLPPIHSKIAKTKDLLTRAGEKPVNNSAEESSMKHSKCLYGPARNDKNKNGANASVNETASYMPLSSRRPEYVVYSDDA